jgi:hypothetical protein
LQVGDPENLHIVNEKVTIGSKIKEIEHKIANGGSHEMCFELFGGIFF